MESALITMPPEARAKRSAKADLPLAVGPAMRIAEGLVKRSGTLWFGPIAPSLRYPSDASGRFSIEKVARLFRSMS